MHRPLNSPETHRPQHQPAETQESLGAISIQGELNLHELGVPYNVNRVEYKKVAGEEEPIPAVTLHTLRTFGAELDERDFEKAKKEFNNKLNNNEWSPTPSRGAGHLTGAGWTYHRVRDVIVKHKGSGVYESVKPYLAETGSHEVVIRADRLTEFAKKLKSGELLLSPTMRDDQNDASHGRFLEEYANTLYDLSGSK